MLGLRNNPDIYHFVVSLSISFILSHLWCTDRLLGQPAGLGSQEFMTQQEVTLMQHIVVLF